MICFARNIDVQEWGNYVAWDLQTQVSGTKTCLLYINMTMVDPGQLGRTFAMCKLHASVDSLSAPCHSTLPQGRLRGFGDLELRRLRFSGI